MSNIEEVSRLLAQWEEENNANQDVTKTLMRLAERFEIETEIFLKKDPDPFDDRHPSRLQPDCTFGHMLKTVFRNERIVDNMVKVYCQRDVVDLNTASCRLLLDILPGLENVVFQEEGFVPRLLQWAEKAPNPLQSYATGLLAAAMDVPEIATNYREKNSYFVPLMLRRLHKLSQQYLQSPPPSDEQQIPKRPFAFLGGSHEDVINNSPEENCKNNSRKASRKKKDGARAMRYSPFASESKGFNQGSFRKPVLKNSPVKSHSVFNEGSNSNWSELEQYVIGSYQVHPLTLAAQQRYILQYLTPMGEYQDLLGHVFEENALPLILRYIDMRQNPDVRLAFEALKYLASLLCHKKIAIEFLNIGGLQLLLKVPFPSIAATGVSICLYYLSYIEEAMEKICLLPSSIISELVLYALWLLECSHDSSRCHATMFFGYAFAFRIILENFDKEDGLRKLFNVMSTLDIFVINNSRTLSDDQIFANRQTTRHVCGALKRYFEAHLVAEVDRQVLNTKKQDHIKSQTKPYKAVNLSYESIENYMETWREMLSPNLFWEPVDEFLKLQGVSFLLDLMTSYFELSYSGRAETVKNGLDVLKICSLTSQTQQVFCKRDPTQDYLDFTGILVLLQAAEGELMPVPDIQRSALHTIINCVCTKIPTEKNGLNDFKDGVVKNSTPKKKHGKGIEDSLNRIWEGVRIKNGIIILINLLSVKSPLTDADSIRALACQALCGLARSEKVKQIISKLPLITEGQLIDLMKEPVLQDKGHDHVQFCKFGLELLERVTGAPVSDGSQSSMLNINKSEIVAKTKVVYNECQLIQLISDHLTSKGFSDTVACLQKEMVEKSLLPLPSTVQSMIAFSTPNRTTSNKSSLMRNYRNSEVFNSPVSLSNSASLNPIPPPSVPLKIVVNKKLQVLEGKPLPKTPSRLQKPQTCSGNYVQTPVMKRQVLSGPYGDSQSITSLDSIVTEYLRKQHALCKNPVLACPPFDLFVPHKCPEPKHKRNAPFNCVLRTHRKQISYDNGGYGGAALDRKFIYSKFRLVRSFRDEEGRFDFVCNSFQNFNSDKKNHPRVLIGTLGNMGNALGRMKIYNINSGEEELTREVHQKGVSHIESSKFSPLIFTSDNGRIGNSALWNSDNFEVVHNFNEIQHLEFGKRTAFRAIGTKHDCAVLIDTTNCVQVQEFPSGDLGNNYDVGNRATFDFSDEFVLSDGLIFDVRSREIVHKLDKFNANFNGVFHPNGREIISNTEIWDLRTFKLLRTVVGLDQCKVVFNQPGTIIYGVYCSRESPDEKTNCFYTFNAYDYSPIATVDVKRPVFHLAVDQHDRYVATIENQFAVSADTFLPPITGVDCVCRLYEIGRTKEEGDEDGEESDDSEEETEDDDDDLDEDENDDGQNDDDAMFEIDEGDDDSSDSSDDETLFSLNTSMEDL